MLNIEKDNLKEVASLNEYCGFSPAQRSYVKKSLDCWLNVAEGGKRAGKNIINILAFAMCVEGHPDKLHLAAGVTQGAAKMNIIDSNGFGLKNYFGGRCREGKYNSKEALFISTDLGEKIIIIEGGSRANDAARIKGNSYGSAYISEVNEMHPDFFFEVMDRTLASSDRRLFFDLNPKPPGHWFYREFLDRQDELCRQGKNLGYNYGHFTIWDNKSIAADRLEQSLKAYDQQSNWYQSEILGKRVAAGGHIYAGFGKNQLVTGEYLDGMDFKQLSVGIDIGGTDATVATLLGISGDGVVAVIDGYYHKQGNSEGYTHDIYAQEICSQVKGWLERFPKLRLGGAVFCESADKLFRQALKNRLRREGIKLNVFAAYKKDGILDRIRLTQMLMHKRKFLVWEGLGKWCEALECAHWDEEALARGDWVRCDNGSYPLDCLDSLEYALVPFKKKLM